MTQPGSQNAPTERDRVISVLCQHYARDHLGLEEFERRIDRAHRARTRDELHSLLTDLPAADESLVPAAGENEARSGRESVSRPQLQGPNAVRVRATEVAICSGRIRKGTWSPARLTHAIAFMGGVELDFREALLPPGETRVYAVAVMGGVDVVVPPGVRVETDGFAVMGGFDEDTDDAVPASDDAPVIRISGFALMGGVDVSCRYPGETVRQAKRRRKEEARRLRRKNG